MLIWLQPIHNELCFGRTDSKNIFLKWLPLWKQRLLICGVWFVISPAQLGGWMCGEWEILLMLRYFFFFLVPFSLSSPTKIYDYGKDKRKTNANCKPRESSWLYFSSPNKLPDQIHLAQSTNQRGNFNPLPNSITLGTADICLTLPCSKFSYELLYKIKKFKLIVADEALMCLSNLNNHNKATFVSKADGVKVQTGGRLMSKLNQLGRKETSNLSLLFVSFGLSMGWMMPIHPGESHLHYSVYQFAC